MGGSNSKYSIFDEYPTNYTDVPGVDDTCVFYGKSWRIEVEGCSTFFCINARRRFPDYHRYEFVYQLIVVNKYHLRRKVVIRGAEKLWGTDYFTSYPDKTVYNLCCEPSYNQFNFQAFAYAAIEKNGLRKMHFGDENVYGKSTTVLVAGESLEVPVQTINIGAPLLAKHIDEKKPNPKLKCSKEFLHVFHGVHVQLKVEEIRSLLKIAAKFQVLNVKRYSWRSFTNGRKYEYIYQFIIINKYHSRKRIVIREVADWFCTTTIDNVFYKPNYNQLNFQVFAYAIINWNGLRKLNFDDENVYGKSTTILAAGEKLEVPIQTIKEGAPLLAKYVDKKTLKPKLKCSEEFFQVFHGVHVQLKVEEIKSLLKFASKFQVLNVKKYCEQQLIRREDLNISDKKKFKMACKFNLNILMNQVLRNVKSVGELAKLASIAIEMESMDANISKLIIAKMYTLS